MSFYCRKDQLPLPHPQKKKFPSHRSAEPTHLVRLVQTLFSTDLAKLSRQNLYH